MGSHSAGRLRRLRWYRYRRCNHVHLSRRQKLESACPQFGCVSGKNVDSALISRSHDGGICLHSAVDGVQGCDERLVLSCGPYGQIPQQPVRHHCGIQRIGSSRGEIGTSGRFGQLRKIERLRSPTLNRTSVLPPHVHQTTGSQGTKCSGAALAPAMTETVWFVLAT